MLKAFRYIFKQHPLATDTDAELSPSLIRRGSIAAVQSTGLHFRNSLNHLLNAKKLARVDCRAGQLLVVSLIILRHEYIRIGDGSNSRLEPKKSS